MEFVEGSKNSEVVKNRSYVKVLIWGVLCLLMLALFKWLFNYPFS